MDAYTFGLSEYTTWPWSFEEDVRVCAELRIPAIEVTEFKLDRERYGDQLRLIDKHALDVSSVQMTVHSLFKDSLVGEPPDLEGRMRHMRGSIEKLAPYLPHGTPFVVITGVAPDGNAERVYDAARRAFRELAEFAHSRRMRIAFEPLNPVLMHTDTSIWSLREAVDLVRDVDHQAFGLCVDFWNIWQSPDVTTVIEEAGDRIFAVQISDWRRPRTNADRRNVGEGEIPLLALVDALRRARYAGPYVLEIFSSESLPDSIWRSDLRTTIQKNLNAFDELWKQSRAA